jgi:hypothetical protein
MARCISQFAQPNVKYYGAVGNGSHDDTQAIDDAIADFKTRGGGAIVFPPGVYSRTMPLPIDTHNISLIGADASDAVGNYATKLLFDLSTPAPAITITARHFHLERFGLQAKGPTSGAGILIDNGVSSATIFRSGIRNVTVSGFSGDGIKVVEGEFVVIEDVLVDGCGGHGLYLYGPNNKGINNTLRRVRTTRCGGHGVYVYGAVSTLLEHVQGLANTGYNVAVEGAINTTISEIDVEEAPGNIGLLIKKCKGLILLGGSGHNLDTFICLEADANYHNTGITLIGPRATATVTKGLSIDPYSDGTVVINHALGAAAVPVNDQGGGTKYV